MRQFLALLLLWMGSAQASTAINRLILDEVRSMPSGGHYSVSAPALQRLRSSMAVESGRLRINPSAAVPSFCSGATYIVLLKTIHKLQERGSLQLDPSALDALMVQGQRDGQGVWGRWNANGPGTARLFHELSLGPSFEDYGRALPGDFMKIFWTPEIGKFERGHLVIYLGTETVDGTEQVRFWSSNMPAGYGAKSVPKSRIARVIFSRLEAPQNLKRLPSLPDSDRFLAEMLTRKATLSEVRAKCGLR